MTPCAPSEAACSTLWTTCGVVAAGVTTADAAVAAAEDFITTRRGAIGAEARTRLAEAQRHLQLAGGDDPVAALREAQQADAMAQQALRAARSDVDRWQGGSSGGAGGLGVDLGSLVLGGILWPRGVQQDVRDATFARVARWLGNDSTGRPHLYTDAAGRLRLGPEVQTDWQMFAALVRRARGDGPAQAELLERALALVRGPLLADRPEGRYAWLAADDLEYDVTAAVADAALRLCEIRLAQGDPEAAVRAVRAGLLLATDDENLWRALLRAVHATGDTARLRAVVDGLHRRAASHPYGVGMAPETEALIDEAGDDDASRDQLRAYLATVQAAR